MKKYACVFHLSLETAMEYRVDFFLSLISTVFPIILQFYLWTAIYSTPTEVNNGYTYEQIILYTLLAGMTAKLTASGFEHEINKDIKDGGLNKYIVRPVNYFTIAMLGFWITEISKMFGTIQIVLLVISVGYFLWMFLDQEFKN